VMDEAEVGAWSIVAACAFVRAGLKLPEKSMIAGLPAKVMRELSEDEIRWKREGTETYQRLTQRCQASLIEAQPLAAEEANRPRLPDSNYTTLQALKTSSGESA